MTQQPYAPQYPQAPAQQYPQAPQGYAPPQQQQYPVQPYGVPAVPAPPQQPLATGTLDDYYNQPSAGSGPSISWSVNGQQKPIGTTYAGIVARDVTNADVQHQTDPTSGTPQYYRDGRPKFVMKVPLKVQQSQEFPEGEATWYVRGQSRDELARAMTEAGVQGAPQAGAVIQVTLVQRRPSRMGNPANIVQVTYTPDPNRAQQQTQQAPETAAPSPAAVPASQPAAQASVAPAAQAFVPQPAQPVVDNAAVPYQQQIPAPQQFQQPQAQPTIQQVPQGVPQGQPNGLPAPAGLDPEQQALLARITGQQQAG